MILDMPHNKLSLTLFSRCFVRFLSVITVFKFFRIRSKIPRNVFNKKGEIRKIGQCLILPSSMGHLHFICWKFVLLFQSQKHAKNAVAKPKIKLRWYHFPLLNVILNHPSPAQTPFLWHVFLVFLWRKFKINASCSFTKAICHILIKFYVHKTYWFVEILFVVKRGRKWRKKNLRT